MTALRAIGLIRVSQRDGDESEHSPEVQARAMTGFAGANDWLLDPADLWDENLDLNGKARKVSGGALLGDRPKLAAAVEAIERGTHQVLLSEHFDRLFRNLDVQREAIRRVEAAGGIVASVKQGRITHATSIGKMLATMQGAANEYVRDTAQERSWDAVEVAIEQGKVPGLVPPGFRRGPDGVFVLGPEDEVEVVREAFRRRDVGATVREVQEYLLAHGIKRTVTGVRKMLGSRLYVGEIHYGKHTPNLKAHPALIDRDIFDRVQKRVVRAGRKAKSERLLARQGVLRCGTCNGRMSASNTGRDYAFYRCANEDCERKVTISAKPIEEAVVRAVIDRYATLQGRASAVQAARKAAAAADKATKTHADFVAIFDPSEPSHVEREARLRQDRDDKKAKAAQLAGAVAPADSVDVKQLFATGSMEARRRLIRATLEVVVFPGRSSGRVQIKLLV